MLVLNLVSFYSRDNAAADASSSTWQSGSNTTVGRLDCTHDCAACGKCFSVPGSISEATDSSPVTASAYMLDSGQ